MYDVFISYRRDSGSEFASFLYQELTRNKYNVFFDTESLRAGPFPKEIERAIDECTFLLVLLAPGDLDRAVEKPRKDWVLREVRCAMESGKIIIPIRIKEDFEFAEKYRNRTLNKLSKLNICDLSGPNAAKNVEPVLIKQFMVDSPAIRLAEEYNKGIISEAYLKWELETLKGIYHDIPFVHAFGRDYPAYIVPGTENVGFPFEELTTEGRLEEVGEKLRYKTSAWYKDFKKIVGPNVHYPDLFGYTSDGFVWECDEDGNDKIKAINAIPRTYKESVFTCHILQYELWRVFQKIGSERPATLDDLPMRKCIHEGRDKNIDVILSGCNRSALNDVSIAILPFDENQNQYCIISAIRTENVATHPGYFSIVPSGGFELYELETEQTPGVIKANFDVKGALYREYLEEILGDSEYDQATGDDDYNRLLRDSRIAELREQVNNKNYQFEFLGVDFDLVTLRQTLAFVLRIDDKSYLTKNRIRHNTENIKIQTIPLSQFEERVRCGSAPVMPESAATYSLLKNSKVYKEIENNNYQLIMKPTSAD